MNPLKYKKPQGLKLKDKIRIDVFPRLATLLHSIGFSWAYLGRTKLGSTVLLAQGNSISKTIRPSQTENPLNIVFLTMLGGHVHNVSVDIALAFGLKQKGHNITFILNDQTLPITEEKKNGAENRWDEISAKSYYYGLTYILSCGFKVVTISQVVDISSKRQISEFKHIVEASLLKHYKVGLLTDDLNNLQNRVKMIEESVKISALVGDYVCKQKPDRVIMSHGIYSTWGPSFEILNKAGIPIVTYSKTKRKKTEKFNWNYTADWWDVSKEWEKVKGLPLNEKQEKQIDQYLKTRITHSEDVLVYNFGALESRQETIKRFRLDPHKITYSLFTNVLWDAASTQREVAFSNPIDWVIQTIEWFRKHEEKQLIVKIHPAEVVIGTNQPFLNIINNKIPSLPANIRIIEPSEKVNSWSIYEITDVGIVHTTTAGMELPLVGVPCIVVSRTHFRDKGFTIDVQSNKEYFDLLEMFEPATIDKESLKILPKRYAYLLFERYQMPFDLFDEVKWTDVRSFTFNNMKELFQKPNFNNIIQAIINKGEFLTHL